MKTVSTKINGRLLDNILNVDGEPSLFLPDELLQFSTPFYLEPIKDFSMIFSSLLFYAFYCYTYFEPSFKIARKNNNEYFYVEISDIKKFIDLLVRHEKIPHFKYILDQPKDEQRTSILEMMKVVNRLIIADNAKRRIETKYAAQALYLMLCENAGVKKPYDGMFLLHKEDIGKIKIDLLDSLAEELLEIKRDKVILRANLRSNKEKVYEDPEQNEFFWQLMNCFPDHTAAFLGMDISIFEGEKLINEEKYKDVFEKVGSLRSLKNKAELYKKANDGDLSAMKFVDRFSQKAEESPPDDNPDKKGGYFDELPDRLVNVAEDIDIDSEMDNINVDLTAS